VNVGLALVVLAASLASGCRPSQRLAYGSGKDVEDILRAYGVTGVKLDCKNPHYPSNSIVRAVACTTTLTPAEVATLTRSVPLAPGPASPAAPLDSCESVAAVRSDAGGVDVLVGKNTKVTNGASRIEVHVAPSGAACVEIAYPFG
jgi:hypothetical protein